MPRGQVYIVGAGPGHPDFLTLKGLRCLKAADVILYDALLMVSFRELFPRTAEVIFVGKRRGLHVKSQEDIQKIMADRASKGQTVVRLKGGDPMVFGRGGEEAMYLAQKGVAFEAVPGVSALNGVAGLLNLPLTHRGVAKEVHIIEGYSLGQDDHDWDYLAKFRGTIVIFMGTRKMAQVGKKLLSHGADGELPVTLIETDRKFRQTQQIFTLKSLADGKITTKTTGPGILYFGQVVKVAADINASKVLPLNFGVQG